MNKREYTKEDNTTFWKMSGYSAYEWKQRKFFERWDTQMESESMYISEFDDFTEA